MSYLSTGVVRQRKTPVPGVTTNKNEMEDLVDAVDRNLSFVSVQKANPSQQGQVFKLHTPLLYSVIPACLVRILTRLLRYSNYTSHLAPTWKQRNLVMLGNYIYRFNCISSKSINGSPIPLDEISVKLVSRRDKEYAHLDDLPPCYNAVFAISSITKTRFYAVSSEEEASTWVNSIRQGHQECIKRKMGHSEHVPYPKAWRHIDMVGENVLQRNNRIKKIMKRHEVRDIELRSLDSGSGGPLSMGVFS